MRYAWMQAVVLAIAGVAFEVTRRLTPEAMIGVVRALIAADVSDVPAKVFAEGRYELIVSVLQQRRQVTARPDGPKAKGFDAALRTLDALRRE
jgi:hypothetical protein